MGVCVLTDNTDFEFFLAHVDLGISFRDQGIVAKKTLLVHQKEVQNFPKYGE